MGRDEKRNKETYNMDIQRINQHTSAFNEITHHIESDNGNEKVDINVDDYLGTCWFVWVSNHS